MLKIQRSANGRVVFTLSGRIEADDVKELRQLLALETAGQHLVLDLRDVTLVNEGAVKFLACASRKLHPAILDPMQLCYI
jgi:anti-anti-sigma regulatory factor